MGMNSAYSPSTLPCRALTPNHPAPNTGMPVPMSTVAKRIRARESDGSSGGGSTARIASASVSHTTVTAVDQICFDVASTSRLRCCSGGRAPYRIVMIESLPRPPGPSVGRNAIGRRIVHAVEGKVAVVTGGANGIGLAMGRHFAGHGMSVMLADIQSGPLDAAVALLRG